MRRLRPDPIPLDVQARILEPAIRAPTESDARRFLLVDDPELRSQLAALYLSVWEAFVDPVSIPPAFQAAFRSGDHLARRCPGSQPRDRHAGPSGPAQGGMLRAAVRRTQRIRDWAGQPNEGEMACVNPYGLPFS